MSNEMKSLRLRYADDKTKQITTRVPPKVFDTVNEHCIKTRQSKQVFMENAIKEKLEREQD